MELEDRISILIEAAQMAQKGGALTLEDASITQRAIVNLKDGNNVTWSVDVLIVTAEKGRKCGIYTFQQAHLIWIAMDNIKSLLTPENGVVS